MASRNLLPGSLVAELDALARRLQVRARSGRGGERLAKRRGASAEFLEHRAYTPGDDLRRVDWSAYARTGEAAMKVFLADEDVVVRLLVDASASLGFGAPTKLETAARLAAGLGYLALARGERAQVLTAGDGLLGLGEPCRGRGGLPRLLRDLEGLEARGATDLARALDHAIKRAPRAGVLVVVSDFFDPHPLQASLARAAAAGHDLVLVQVLAAEELRPTYDGDYALEDGETGETVDVTIDEAATRAYLERLEALFAGLRASARKLGASYVRVESGGAALEAIRRVVARSVD